MLILVMTMEMTTLGYVTQEGRVGKDGKADILLLCKAGPSIWIVVCKRTTFLIAIVLISL